MAGARSTRASAAVERLKRRTGITSYSMARTGAGHFFLSEKPGAPPLCPPLEMDDFVAFVDGLGPQPEKRMTKNDIAFEKQLVRKKP
ncbi:hypothetical protein [uncultured Massilia sp.]|uniref:hypothetical protein n=1 Tax=uncultured Massilia sp. TaxID=169973 RepID=UPI0025DAF259|nr:hypothetical protein [uncultured Massilia sp.]